jgi:ATPase subunit of ABC transporter with duplicated ATPase domains
MTAIVTTNATAARRPVSIGAVRRAFAPWADSAAVPLIRFENVTKRFGEASAVDGLSLDIFEREFFCLLGPSGCGKSTLMRASRSLRPGASPWGAGTSPGCRPIGGP